LEIADDPAWMQSQEELEELAGTLTDSQIRGVLDRLATEQSCAANILGEVLVRRWATSSLADAVLWAQHLPDTSFTHAVYKEIALAWAEKDLAGAVAWVQQLPAGENKTAAAFSLAFEAAAQKAAVTAINLTINIPPGPERDDLLTYAAQQWATTDTDGAVAWIKKIQDPALRETMLGKVAVNLGVDNPFAAAELIATSMGAGQIRDNAVINVVRFWTASAPEKTAAWVEQFPEGELRVAAMENLFDVWNKDDPKAASVWATTML